MSYITLRNTSIGYDQLDQGQFEEAHETSFAHGAAMAVKAIDIQKFGKMPEFYFLYYEELDWCTQIQKTGFSIWFEPKAIIYHKERASVGIESPLRIYYQMCIRDRHKGGLRGKAAYPEVPRAGA